MNLSDSYRYCMDVSRKEAKNFYYSFIFLPARKKRSMCAVYAFMRASDDIVDSGSSLEDKIEKLNTWKGLVKDFLDGKALNHPVFPALQDTVREFKIPKKYFIELVEGMEMDLTPRKFESFEDLYPYCYKVASVVGLVCLHIFEFEDPSALKHAEACGIAFQLTNILRDIKEDMLMNRIYLPRQDMERCSYTENDLKSLKINDAFRELVRFETSRTESYYEEARPLINLIHLDSRQALKVMIAIYEAILEKIKKKNYDTISERIRLNFFEKSVKILLNLF
jgi:phytoene synthase